MSTNQTKSLKPRTQIDLEPYNFIRARLILDNAIGDLNVEIKYELKNLNDVEIKIMMQEGKIVFERIRNSFNEFDINELEIKINAEIKILENEEKKIRCVIVYF